MKYKKPKVKPYKDAKEPERIILSRKSKLILHNLNQDVHEYLKENPVPEIEVE